MSNSKNKNKIASINDDYQILQLGEALVNSPLSKDDNLELKEPYFVKDDKGRIGLDIEFDEGVNEAQPSFEKAGPRHKLFFDPRKTRAAVVTCGGLCPGLNDVLRSVVQELYNWYDVKEVLGIKYGYSGLSASTRFQPIVLTPALVANIHLEGGTILGSSRGHSGIDDMVKTLVDREVDILFCIGGDGTLHGAHELAKEILKRKLKISVVGIPKTIDNDIPYVFRSFGFQTAVAEARKVLECAHIEAMGAPNGVGLVKLMGREAGFITSHATRASGDVDFCFIPEMEFPLDKDGGFLDRLRLTIKRNHHAVIAVAEGAGQHLIGDTGKKDDSGNKVFNDIGRYLREAIEGKFAEWREDINVKYFSPSYMIRSVPADSYDSIFAADLARYAVDAAMAGKTDMMIGYWHGEFTHVPLDLLEKAPRKRMKQHQSSWLRVLASTGQPPHWW